MLVQLTSLNEMLFRTNSGVCGTQSLPYLVYQRVR